MAYTTINKSTDNFNTKLYTGNGSAGHGITGVGHQPDWVWIKNRQSTHWHQTYDAVRGTSSGALYTNQNSAEDYMSGNGLASFNSDGFTVNSNDGCNSNGENLVAWNWKANGSSTTTNNDGATTSYISHNSTAQFSIIKYTGTGSNTNIGHGLNGTPDCFITKGYSGATDWHLWNNSFTVNQRIKINSTGGVTTNTSIFPALPDATKIYLGSGGDVNQSGIQYICYAWKNVTGYSKFGSYTGNGSSDGTFVYTGFKPAFVMIKRTDDAANWSMVDSKRDTYNSAIKRLFPDLTNAENTSLDPFVDLVSNGFKLQASSTAYNGSGGSYIYMAFGQSIVGSNNIPATAR